jgi:hypothetical protein
MRRSLRLLLRPITPSRADILDAPQDLHQLIDGFQAQLADLDEAIHDVWFARGPA